MVKGKKSILIFVEKFLSTFSAACCIQLMSCPQLNYTLHQSTKMHWTKYHVVPNRIPWYDLFASRFALSPTNTQFYCLYWKFSRIPVKSNDKWLNLFYIFWLLIIKGNFWEKIIFLNLMFSIKGSFNVKFLPWEETAWLEYCYVLSFLFFKDNLKI